MATRYFGLVVLLSTALCACMATPRNKQQLSAPNAQFSWSGWVVNPSETETLKVKDQSDGSWDTRWTAVSSTTSNTDGFLTWFPFGATNVTLRYGTASSHRKYWRMENQGSQRRMVADVLTVSPTRGNLFSFDVNADSCIYAQTTGQAVVNNCRSGNSPVAAVFANCGKADQACCLANGVGTASSCDRNRICDTSALRCSIPAGGFHQPCQTDGSCNDSSNQCVDGVCRAMIQRAPVLTSSLVVHTCDKADAGTKDEIWVSLGGSDIFFLDHPGSEAARNQTDTWGLVVPGIHSISDISELRLGIENGEDAWCVDRVDLFVNGAKIFSKSYGSGIWLQRINDPIFPTDGQLQVADTTTIRDAIDAVNRTQACKLPSSFSYADIESMLAAKLGDVFARSRAEWGPDDHRFDASWGSFRPIVSRVNASTIKAAIKFRATAELDNAPDFDITGNVEVTASSSCSVQAEGQSSTFGPTHFTRCTPNFNVTIRVTKAEGIPDTGVPFVESIVRWIATEKIADEAFKAVQQVPDLHGYFDSAEAMACVFDFDTNQLCDPNDNICSCPSITANSSSIGFSWLSITSIPDLLCLR